MIGTTSSRASRTPETPGGGQRLDRVPVLTLLVAVSMFASACGKTNNQRPPKPTIARERDAGASASPPTVRAEASERAAGSLHFIAVGGGPTPESTEISLEQDIELVERTLPDPGAVLFAGGKGSVVVR